MNNKLNFATQQIILTKSWEVLEKCGSRWKVIIERSLPLISKLSNNNMLRSLKKVQAMIINTRPPIFSIEIIRVLKNSDFPLENPYVNVKIGKN